MSHLFADFLYFRKDNTAKNIVRSFKQHENGRLRSNAWFYWILHIKVCRNYGIAKIKIIKIKTLAIKAIINCWVNIFTCYRRELKKVVKSQKSGSGVDDIYVSNLWYYEAFDFCETWSIQHKFRWSWRNCSNKYGK